MFTIKRSVVVVAVFLGVLSILNNIALAGSEHWLNEVKVRVIAEKNTFLLGEPIAIKIEVTNQHSEMIQLLRLTDSNFKFSAQNNSGKPVQKLKKPYMSGLRPTVSIQPETTFNKVIFINEHLAFLRPGTYTVSYNVNIPLRKGARKKQTGEKQSIQLSGTISVNLNEGSADALEEALNVFLTQIKSEDRKLQQQGVRALSVAEPTLAVKLLKEALEAKGESNTSYAGHVTWALAKIGTNSAIQTLLNVAKHSDNEELRTKAIRELGKWRIAESVPTLTEILSDTNANIRIAALKSLGRIGDKSSVSEVERKLSDSNANVRNVAEKVHKILTESDQDKQKRIMAAKSRAREIAERAKNSSNE